MGLHEIGCRAAVLIALLVTVLFADQSLAADPVVTPDVDGVLAAFDTHPLVGLGDMHGLANEGAFYNRLVSDPRFAARVGNVVVEFGTAAHQDTLDRYLAGEDVPYDELRLVWTDNVVGAFPPEGLQAVMYQYFFAAVRAVNLKLPPNERIHVWLGEPPAEISKIHSRADWPHGPDLRDAHAAQVIEQDILAKGKKALVIYGGLHFHAILAPPGFPPAPTLRELVERTHPGAFYTVGVYFGYVDPACSAAFEAQAKLPNESLAAPVRSTPLEAALLRPGCRFFPKVSFPYINPGTHPPIPTADLDRMDAAHERFASGVEDDALLYLGPAASLMESPPDPTAVMDTGFFNELSRVAQLLPGGQPWDFAKAVGTVSSPPHRYNH